MVGVKAKPVTLVIRGDDGDHMSDNRSTEGTWPWTRSCVPCTSQAVGFSEASGEVRTGVSYSIYELRSYSEVSTAYIREVECKVMTGKVGELCTVQKRNCGRVSITKSGSGTSGSGDQKSNRKRVRHEGCKADGYI